MRALLLVTLALTAGCSGFQTGFKKGFDKSFVEKCIKSAREKGATEARAKEYCQCALQKVEAGSSIDKAAEACQ
jgi:hypothetical protein